jgi:catechol 2,3-dioxygenase-like lactoylglutathione lyase family enzyme
MPVTRIVPYTKSASFEETKDFYVGLLGLEVAMDGSDYLGLASPANPNAQIVVARDGVETPLPGFGIDMGDAEAVDAAYAEAKRRGLEVVYPPTDEPWGIRRFFVRDPGGTVLSVLAHHRPQAQ